MSVFKYSSNASSWWLGDDFDNDFVNNDNKLDFRIPKSW